MFTIPEKSAKDGLMLPVLGMGTWQFGGRAEADYSRDDETVAALSSALDDGFTHIDTAEMYGAGHTEELIGKAIQGRPRESFRMTGKVWVKNYSYDGVMRSVEGTLKRLGVSFLDLFLVHQPSPDADEVGMARAFRKLYDEGVLKHLGVSNFTAAHWQKFETLCERPVEANQVHYNLRCREPESGGVLQYAQTHGKLLIAWRPLQKGALAASVPLLDELARKYAKTPAQIALNFLIAQPCVVTIAAMRSAAHRAENAGACGWLLASEDVERLRRDYPGQYFTSDVVPLG